MQFCLFQVCHGLGVIGLRLCKFGSGRINPGGFVNRSVVIPDAASGLTTYIVWVDLDGCEVSAPYRYDWP